MVCGPTTFCIAFSVVFGANFNKFGVLSDLNDLKKRKSNTGLHNLWDKLQQVWRLYIVSTI